MGRASNLKEGDFMRATLRMQSVYLLLFILIGLAIPATVQAMTDLEAAQYETTYEKAVRLIEEANEQAEQSIEDAIEAATNKAFDFLVEKTNERMADCLRKLQPLVDEMTRLSGREHRATCEYVHVYNSYLNRSALIDPIHLTSSGD